MLKSKKSKTKSVLIGSFLVFLLVAFCGLLIISITYIATPLNKSKLLYSNLGVEIYNQTTSTTTPISYSSDKKIVSLEYLPKHTLNAFISIEDKRFYEHNGYDLKRIIKAGIVNLKTNSKSQGASTITQQLVKNLLLNSEKTYSRKIKEVMLAIKTENNFSKEEILNMYLNSIYFGSNAYGVENASNLYFDKSASALDINESAILAGIIKSPTYYSPINNPDNCFKRKNLVLKQMYNNGFITNEQYEENIKKPIRVGFKKNNYDNSYNQQVILEACELLNISEKELLRQGLKIHTYQNSTLQQVVENAVRNSAFSKDKLCMVADNEGRVLAYFGDSYYDLSKMRRNPASTLKPLIIYLPAIANNLISPITPLLDEKLEEGYSPNNAGDEYLGYISARKALATSSNTCAVRLVNELGLDSVNEYGQKLNLFNTFHNNPSIALGNVNNGVEVLNLARAYGVLQNEGVDKGITFINKIEKDGKVIYQNQGFSQKLFKQEDCMLINDMLKTCAKEGTAKRLDDLPFEVASKTGTAQIENKNTDLWNIAYTTEHLCLSWCGDATSKGLENPASSGFYPTSINKQVLSAIYSNHYPSPFTLSENIIRVAVDNVEYTTLNKVSLASENTPERYKIYELFKDDNAPCEVSLAYVKPNLDLDIQLTTSGAKLSLDYNPNYIYQIFASANNSTRLVGDYLEPLYDEKVYNFKNINYYAVATNKYTNYQTVGNKSLIKPQEYLVDILTQNFINQNRQTKKKWYV